MPCSGTHANCPSTAIGALALPGPAARIAPPYLYKNIEEQADRKPRLWAMRGAMRGIYDDVRVGVRRLRDNPGFTASCVLTLVLGILLNTAAFGVVNALWFGKLPFRDDHEIVVVRTASPDLGPTGLAWTEYLAVSAVTPAFSGAAAFQGRVYNLSLPVAGALPEQVSGGMMSASTMDVLGYTPVLGRGFTAEEEGSYDEATGAPVVLISESLWRNQFGADPSVIGRRLTLDGAPAVIVGVFPTVFRFVYGAYQVIVPLSHQLVQSQPEERSLQVLARVRPGVSVDVVNEQLRAVSVRLNEAGRLDQELRAAPYREAVFAEAARMYPILLAAALLLLLLVCANLSNLFLAKAAARSREMAIRLAIGARWGRIVRQLITESALLALAGAAISLVLAAWMTRIIVARVPGLSPLAVDARVVVYTLGIAVIAGLAIALAPALHVARQQVSETLKSGGLPEGARGYRLRGFMMATQVAVALVLLTGTGLLVRTVASLRFVDKGMDLEGVVATTLHLKGARYMEPEQRLLFWERLVEGVSAFPGIEVVGVTGSPPLTNGPAPERLEVEGQRALTGDESMRLVRSVADAGYMTAIRQGILAGRGFMPQDHADSPQVVLVNEAFAQQFWPGTPRDAIGHRIRVGADGQWVTVVGVARNARQLLPIPPVPEVTTPVAQAPRSAATLVVRAPGLTPQAVRELVLRELRLLDPDIPTSGFLTEASIIEMFYPKVMIAGLGIFAAAAIGLAAVGLYGVISFVVARRSREIGIRMALGATRSSIVRTVLRQGFRIVLLGTAVGMAGALALSRVLEGYLYDIPAGDPLVFAVVPFVVAGVALLALLTPALRASRIDPSGALRAD